jgi:hypothetical protein
LSPREKARAGTRGERESKGRGQGQGVNAVGVRGCSYSVRLDRLGSAWIGMDPGLGWKPAHTGVSAHVDAELRIWLTPGWSQTRLNHVNPREREISSPEAGTFAPAARDSASAPDSPARATPPLALEKGMFSAASNSRWTHSLLPSLLLSRFPLLGFQYTAAADDGIGSWRFGWRETVATPRPEVRIYSSHFPSPPLVLLEHASMTVGCLNLLVRCRVPRSCATFFFNKIWILFS